MKIAALTVTVVMLALSGLAPATASALVELRPESGQDTPVWAWVGSDAANNRPMVCYARASDLGLYEKQYFFGSIEQTSLSEDASVHGTRGDDTMFVVVAPTLTPCGLMRTLNQNGWRLSARGGAGNDSLRGGAVANTVLCGDDGNDIVDITTDFGVASGGGGDDAVSAISPLGTREVLLGGSGNDCLFDANALASLVSGGSGRDGSPLFVPWVGMPVSARCNTGGSCDVEGYSALCLP
jgi:Ca2+-binding RTX toxin-like protein